MYSIANIILIILTYQCIIFLGAKQVGAQIFSQDVSNDSQDCYINPIKDNFEVMPILYLANTSEPFVLHPNENGYYHFSHNTSLMLSCMGNHFVSPSRVQTREIRVQCLNGFLYYRNRPQILAHFQCSKTPHSKLILTNITCQGEERNKIINVVFVTTTGLLPLYKICYDTVAKNTLYSWLYVNSPVDKYRQVSQKFQKFIHTSTFEDVYASTAYNNQTETLESILGSKFLAGLYIKKTLGKHYLIPCLLTPKNVFPYVLEQEATHYYENTVPQWLEFNQFAWSEVEMFFRKNMIRGHVDHVIITGSYGTLSFEDTTDIPQPFYLSLPMRMKVPLFVWKMYYNAVTGSGTVFIGLNNPYREIDENIFFCKTIPCPGNLSKRNTKRDLVFCCTKNSFEKVYGKLDSVVFEKFLD